MLIEHGSNVDIDLNEWNTVIFGCLVQAGKLQMIIYTYIDCLNDRFHPNQSMTQKEGMPWFQNWIKTVCMYMMEITRRLHSNKPSKQVIYSYGFISIFALDFAELLEIFV